MSRRLAFTVRTDWFRVIVDLERKGWSGASIADHLQVGKPTLFGWKNHGAEPAHAAGHRLLLLWTQQTGRQYEQRPMLPRKAGFRTQAAPTLGPTTAKPDQESADDGQEEPHPTDPRLASAGRGR